MEFTGIILAGGESRRLEFNKVELKVLNIPLLIVQIFKLSFFCSELLIITSEKNKPIIDSQLKKLSRYSENFFCSPLFKDFLAGKVVVVDFNVKKITDNLNIKVIIDDEKDFKSVKLSQPVKDKSENSISAGAVIGVYTGLKNSSNFYSFVTASDMPFISAKFIKYMMDNLQNCSVNTPGCDGAVVKTSKGFEVLSALYSKNCLAVLHSNIVSGIYKISEIFNFLSFSIITEPELFEAKLDLLNFFNINSKKDLEKFLEISSNFFKIF